MGLIKTKKLNDAYIISIISTNNFSAEIKVAIPEVSFGVAPVSSSPCHSADNNQMQYLSYCLPFS